MVIQCNGHFDLLHVGHLEHLKQAKALGGEVIVTMPSGAFMTKFGHPIFSDDERKTMLEGLRYVDRVIVMNDLGPYKAIELVKPDIYVKGKEYIGRLPEQKFCEDRGIRVEFLGDTLYGSTKLMTRLLSTLLETLLR